MKMMRINQIWEELESDQSSLHGLVLRRYSSTFLPDVFIAIKQPEKFRCIASSIDSSRKIDLRPFSNLQDIAVELSSDESRPGKNILLIKLLSKQHQDIFSIICEDLIDAISTITSENQLIKVLLNRFDKWKSIFDRVASPGLSKEEQRGLYGELFFLQKCLKSNMDFLKVIDTWNGPEKGAKDFLSDKWGVEIKTSTGNNPQKIQISSEKQLDSENLESLFLFHINLEEIASGITLNGLVENIIELLKDDYISYNRFRNKLLEAGYFDEHRNLYETPRYYVKKGHFYLIEKEFPRIQKAEIRDGVEEVKYSIIIEQCSTFTVSEETAFKNITFI